MGNSNKNKDGKKEYLCYYTVLYCCTYVVLSNKFHLLLYPLNILERYLLDTVRHKMHYFMSCYVSWACI